MTVAKRKGPGRGATGGPGEEKRIWVLRRETACDRGGEKGFARARIGNKKGPLAESPPEGKRRSVEMRKKDQGKKDDRG